MNRTILVAALLIVGLFASATLSAQNNYQDHQQLQRRLRALAESYPALVELTSLTETAGGRPIWLLTIGQDDRNSKPGLAVVGGVDGKYPLGVELAVGFAEQLLASAQADPVRSLLEKQVFYVLPNMSPDATEQFFAALQFERSGNAGLIDSDRDYHMGEDGFEDLNGDGKITMMRIKDPTGAYILHPNDPRVMILADKTNGQYGTHRLLTEGLDNDGDGQFNEDGPEGVHFNRNLPYNYQNFAPGAGDYAVSEPESRALLDFLYDAFNIYAVVSFGPYNNLLHPISGTVGGSNSGGTGNNSGRRGSGPITGWSAEDAQVNQYAASRYQAIIGSKSASRYQAQPGDFAEWVYFHYGRLSFGTPGWWIPASERTSQEGGGSRQNNRPDNQQADYLRWADKEGITTQVFTEWTAVKHPDFPGKEVEVGGVHPFVMHTPPDHLVPDLIAKHGEFLLALAEMAPLIEFRDVVAKKIDEELTRISLKVFNTGMMPTLTQVGERSYFLKKIALDLHLGAQQTLISGLRRQTLGAIPGRGYVEVSWLIRGSGDITVTGGSPQTGTDQVKLSL